MAAMINGEPWFDQDWRQVRYWARLEGDEVLCAVDTKVLQDRFLALELTEGTQQDRYLRTFDANASEILTRTLSKKAAAVMVPSGNPAIVLKNEDFPFSASTIPSPYMPPWNQAVASSSKPRARAATTQC